MVSPVTTYNVTGNVNGVISNGDNNFIVNDNHGTIIYKQAGQKVSLIELAPRAPRAPRTFVGRECELQELGEWIAKRQPVLLQGIDGAGKTTLLKQAANSQAAQGQKNGVLYLEGIDQAGKVLAWEDLQQLLFDSLFSSDPPLKVNAASARTYLSNTSPLVLLDNLQLPEAAYDDLAELFPEAPILAVTTSRVDSDAFELYPIDALPPNEAIDLLAARARITVDDSARPLLEKIVTLLGNLPLALVTVGNAIREYKLTMEQTIDGLTAIPSAPGSPTKAAIERSIQFAQSFLSPEERQMMGLAAAAPAVSTSREWLEKTSGGLQASERLENLALLQPNSPRLRLHPEYAPFVLQGADVVAIRKGLRSAILSELKNRSLDFAYVKDELGNILGLINWSIDQGDWQEVISLARAVNPYVVLHGLWEAWRRILEAVLQAARKLGNQAVEAWALHELGTRLIGTGDLPGAETTLRQALELRKKLGDDEGAAYTLHNLGLLPVGAGESPTASPYVTAARKRRSPVRWIVIALIVLALLSLVTAGALARAGAISLPLGMGWLAGKPSPTPTPTQTAIPTATQTATPTSTATSTSTSIPTSTLTPTPTQSLTPTASPTITLTPTQTATPTITLTPTITSTPTQTPFALPTFVVASRQAFCQYGPGMIYLPAADLFQGDTGTVNGRNPTNTWLYLHLDKNNRYCWANAGTLTVTGDIKTLKVTPANLPISPDSPPPTGTQATRNGNQVTVTWDPMPIAPKDARGYLLTVSVCLNNVRTPMIIQTNNTSYVFTDDVTCTGTSKGQIQSVTVRGYSTPVDIPWP